LSTGLSHSELVRQITTEKRINKKFKVYVYDNGIMLPDSPFNSYADAHEAIGLNRSSTAIGKNIDTVRSRKFFKQKYQFYSNKLI
jgi:hypothetical protein